ncbi:glycosyltransferase family 2 protein [Sphingomonas lenta]|nr:glycosyltransferase family 2 protein [Sphingomonas lenta]
MPRVSVVIAAYNAAGYIEQALDSVAAQTMGDWEVLVADDGSADDTCAVVERRAADGRIRLLRAECNGGPSAARNRAIDAARGDWIAVLDADDRWRPKRLERMLAVAEGEGAAIVADNYVRYDEGAGRELGAVLPVDDGVSAITPARFLDSERPFGSVRFGLLKPVVSRAFLNAHTIRYPTEIRYAEDFHFFMRVLLAGGKGVLVHEPFYLYTLPRSMASSAVSGGTRTVPRHADRLWIADTLLALHGDAAPPETRAALHRYRRSMRTLGEGHRVHDLWRSGRRARALLLAATRPLAVLSYGWTLPRAKRLRARLRGR